MLCLEGFWMDPLPAALICSTVHMPFYWLICPATYCQSATAYLPPVPMYESGIHRSSTMALLHTHPAPPFCSITARTAQPWHAHALWQLGWPTTFHWLLTATSPCREAIGCAMLSSAGQKPKQSSMLCAWQLPLWGSHWVRSTFLCCLYFLCSLSQQSPNHLGCSPLYVLWLCHVLLEI